MCIFVVAGCAGEGSRLPYENLNAEYVGLETCATCHPDKAATYQESQMGRSWSQATRANSVADFENATPIYDPHNNLYYQALARGDSLYIQEYRLSSTDTVHHRLEKIDYIVGSGHHTNSHIMDVGGYLFQMPLTWYVQDSTWDLPPGFEGGNNARFDRPIISKCITCHNGMPSFVEGSYNKYDVVPHGIDCERCHGAGSIHVEAMRSGRVVDITREVDYTIVNPAKLPVELQFNICQGCHVQGAAVPQEGRSFADFRPGMPLASIENVFWPRFADSLRQFVMASHPDRLTQSACYLQSPPDAPLTCITCHDPHVPIETLGSNHYDAVCSSCHASPEHSTPISDSCVTCHMPVSGSKDIPHVRITDHFIRTPDTTASTVLTTESGVAPFVRMASLIDPNPTPKAIAQGYLTYYEEVTDHPGFLDSAAVYLQAAQERSSLEAVAAPLVRMYYLAGDYEAITRLARDLDEVEDAWTAYRIGDAYLKEDSPGAAEGYLEQATTLAPANVQFRRRLAGAYVHLGDYEKAIDQLDDVLAAHPKYAEAYSDRGYAQLPLERFDGAEKDFLAAIRLSPDLQAALANLASLYNYLERPEEARPIVQRLLDLDPTNIQYHRLWEAVQ